MSSLDDLDPEQRERLLQFWRQHGGKNYKEVLFELWWSGRDANEPDGHLLRQIRNRFGPSWLAELKIE